MLWFSRISCDGAAPVGLHVRVDATVTEDEAGGGQHCGVRIKLSAQRAVPVPSFLAAMILLQVERGWRSGQGGERFNRALVVGGVPPLQELQEEDAQGEGGGERDGDASHRL